MKCFNNVFGYQIIQLQALFDHQIQLARGRGQSGCTPLENNLQYQAVPVHSTGSCCDTQAALGHQCRRVGRSVLVCKLVSKYPHMIYKYIVCNQLINHSWPKPQMRHFSALYWVQLTCIIVYLCFRTFSQNDIKIYISLEHIFDALF